MHTNRFTFIFAENAKTVTENRKSSKKQESDIEKELALSHNGNFHDRLKSAGLISNATFIIDSKDDAKNDK